MNSRRIILVILVLLCASLFGGVAKAAQGKVDYWNGSWESMAGQEVTVSEKNSSSEYLRVPFDPRKLRIYGWGPTIINPTPHAISPIGIEQGKTYVLEFRFEAGTTMPNDKDNAIDINWMGPEGGDSSYAPFERLGRNFVMRQNPDSPRAGTSEEDTNVYDLLDLTNYFTANAQITLPDITASTPRTPDIYDKWQKIISNYADLSPSVFEPNLPDGLVNLADFSVIAASWEKTDAGPSNNWHKGADLNRDGNVGEIDLSLFSEQWICDPNTIR